YGPAKAGVNQFVWNMSYDAATQLDFEKIPAAFAAFSPSGPSVLPGTYKVAVTADGQTQTTTVTVNSDPNQHIPLDVMRADLKIGLEVRNETSAFDEMLNRIVAMQDTLDGFEQTASAHTEQQARYTFVLTQAKALNKKLTDLKNSVYNPGLQHMVVEDNIHYLSHLNGDLQALSGIINLVGQMPTAPMQGAAAEVSAKLNAKLAEFNAILVSDVPAYNKTAYAAGAPTLMVGQPINIKPVRM
ncbi:MAG: hypothetical protein ACRESA_09660, partial [Gammaproteobacteria bacterium]